MIGTSGQRAQSSSSVKAILSGLYIAWSTDPESLRRIKGAIEETFVIAARESPSPDNFSRNGAARARYTDPGTGLSTSGAQSAGGGSPSETPPGRLGQRRSEERTPSPARQPAPTRFMGVDELDQLHRGGSPGMPQSSAHTRPVVDPMAPLPLQHGTTTTTTTSAATTTGGMSSAVAAATGVGEGSANAAMPSLDFAAVLDREAAASTTLRESMSGRFVHGSGSYAAVPPPNVQRATLRQVPIFYTSNESKGVLSEPLEEETAALTALLGRGADKLVKKEEFGEISLRVFKVPMWLKNALFQFIVSYAGIGQGATSLTAQQIRSAFTEVYATLTPSRRLFELILGDKARDHITIDDLKTMTSFLIESHPGLEFLHQPEFQEYYCRTVAIRIMYSLERQQCRKVYWRDFDRSNLPEVMIQLDSKDVNQVMEYFSYEHFYVLYCKFWELDTDRDLLVDYNDLCNYGQGAVVPAVVKRVIEGYGRPLTSGEAGRLDFEDFVYFCLSEEDKNTEPAVYYWFKILDSDGDGVLSGYELGTFFRENEQRFLEYMDNPDEEVAYGDIMCQMLDMLGFDRIKTRKFGVTLGDLRACPTPANFFNMVFNAPKFMLFEHRDPFSEHQRRLQLEKTDWDRFAREEYDRMAAEA